MGPLFIWSRIIKAISKYSRRGMSVSRACRQWSGSEI